MFTSVATLLFLPGKLFQHMPGKNAAARKLCTLVHQIEDDVFSFEADDGQVAQVDDQFASA
jgi:hypothetical protein